MTDSVRRAMNIAASARENSVLLSLVDPGDTASAFDHVQPVRQVGTVWPLAMIAQILVVAACVALATRADHPALVPQILVEGGLAAAADVAVFEAVRLGRGGGLDPPPRSAASRVGKGGGQTGE